MGPSGCGKTTLLNCLSGLDAVDAGEVLIEGVAAVGDVGPRAHGLPRPPHGLRLPVLQPDAGPDGGRERRAAAAGHAGRRRRGAPPRVRGARARRHPAARPAPPRAALGRRAPAGHHRPRARQRPGDRLGRRAHRRPRQRQRRGDHRAAAPPQPRALAHAADRHPRPVGRRGDGPHHPDGRRRRRRRRTRTRRGPSRRPSAGADVQKLFGIPMGDLAVGLAIVLGLAIGVDRRPRAAQPLPAAPRPAQPDAAPRARRADRRRADARHDDHRLGAGDRRHDEPDGPRVGDRVARPDGRAGRGPRDRPRGRAGDGDVLERRLLLRGRVPAVERALRRSRLVDGVAPAIVEPVALQDRTSRRTEARRLAVRRRPGADARLRDDPQHAAATPCRWPTWRTARCTSTATRPRSSTPRPATACRARGQPDDALRPSPTSWTSTGRAATAPPC